MSTEAPARRAEPRITFDGTDISAQMKKYLLSMSVTDNEEDEADDLQITLQDRAGMWAEKWLVDLIEAIAETTTDSTEKQSMETLTVGSRGASVVMMQELLIAAGFSLPAFGADGAFGQETSAALMKFQAANGLAQDGVCGQKTWNALQGITDEEINSGAAIRAAIIRKNWNGPGADEVCGLGSFTLDHAEYDGPPSVVTICGTALNFNSTIRTTKKSKGWEKYKLSGIAAEMTAAAGISLSFHAKTDPYYERVEQLKESDIAFLKRLCHNAGLSLKSYDNRIVIFDQAEFEEKAPTFKIKKRKTLKEKHTPDSDYTAWHLSVGKAETEYTSCRVSYTDPETGACVEGIARVPDYESRESHQQLEVTAKVGSTGEALTLAEKRLRLRNKFCQIAEFDLPGRPSMTSGITGELEGWGGWDGKYIVRQAVQTVGPSGYKTHITLRKVLEGY